MARDTDKDQSDQPTETEGQNEPPPYDPDPRLITELERGRRRIQKDRADPSDR